MKRAFSKGIPIGTGVLLGLLGMLIGLDAASKDSKSPEENTEPAYATSLAVAETVDALIRASRDQYTRDVVAKLEKEGTGASVDYQSHPGHVPVPEQLLGAVAEQLNSDQVQGQEPLFSFVHRSRWYLNPANNLKENFEKEGWDFLMGQQEEQQKSGKSLKGIKWKPFVRVEAGGVENEPVLRYLSPVVASETSCVNCHNKWEQMEEIKTIRELRGITPGKAFKSDELLGAVSITVPISAFNLSGSSVNPETTEPEKPLEI